jgi:WD40 repeat protein
LDGRFEQVDQRFGILESHFDSLAGDSGCLVSRGVLRETMLTESLQAAWSVAISPIEKFWAAGIWRGGVRVWHEGDPRLHLVWQAHTKNTFTLAFSPDERTLACGSWDGTVKLWAEQSNTLLWTGFHV